MNNHLDSSGLDDGFTATRLFSQGYSYTYDDVIFHPGFIDFPADAVDLSTRISKHLPLSIPCVASPMETVSETSMAVTMASLGGIAIVHSNCSPSRQSSILRSAKSHRLPFAYDPSFLSPSDSVTESNFATSNFLIVTESGSPKSKPIGIVAKSYWEKLSNKDAAVSTYMQPVPKSCSSSSNFEQVATFLADEKLEVAPIVSDDGEVLDLVTDDIVEKIRSYPKLGSLSLGGDGRFLVGAAIGTREDDKERLEALVIAGANVTVVDSSQGNSSYQIDMIKYVKGRFGEVDVIGGNVVTMGQAQNLIQAGVDGLRVGMGSGSICTTQEVCAVGRGQAMSERNFKNRLSEKRTKHTTGNVSYAEFETILEQQNNGVKPRADVIWLAVHTRKNDQGKLEWTDDGRSKKIHELQETQERTTRQIEQQKKDMQRAMDAMKQELLAQVTNRGA